MNNELNDRKKYSRPDQNFCVFTCRVTTHIEYEMKSVKGQVKPTSFVCFSAVNNSNAWNYKKAAYIDFIAWGKIADELFSKVGKGSDIWVMAQYINTFKNVKEKDGKVYREDRGLFNVKEFGARRDSIDLAMLISPYMEGDDDPRSQDQLQRLLDSRTDQT